MSFSFIQITDHHLGESAQDNAGGYPAAETFKAVLNSISSFAQEFDFLLSTGDLVNKPNEASYRYFMSLLNIQPAGQVPGPHIMSYGRLKDFPVYLMPGNHDDRDVFFRSLYVNGVPGLQNAVFRHKGVKFVMVDWGPGVRAVLDEQIPGFLERALADGTPAVILTHHNAAPLQVRLLDDFLADGIQSFYKILRGKNVLAVLSGHLHTTYQTQAEGIPVLGLRSTAFQFRIEERLVMALMPMHYRVVSIDDQFRLSSRIVEVPIPPDVRMQDPPKETA